jgi:hypothetical protein
MLYTLDIRKKTMYIYILGVVFFYYTKVYVDMNAVKSLDRCDTRPSGTLYIEKWYYTFTRKSRATEVLLSQFRFMEMIYIYKYLFYR